MTTCGKCAHWNYVQELVRRDGVELGHCTAHAPTVFQIGEDLKTRFPLVNEYQKCGEFRPEKPDYMDQEKRC